MNKREALNLKLSEEEFKDEKGREYKTYTLLKRVNSFRSDTNQETEEVEYKLYGDLTPRRLDGELPEEYKIRRYFIQAYSNKPGTMVWFSKNKDTMHWYNIARGLKNVDQDKINTIKENTIMTNLGTYNKKVLEQIIKESEN